MLIGLDGLHTMNDELILRVTKGSVVVKDRRKRSASLKAPPRTLYFGHMMTHVFSRLCLVQFVDALEYFTSGF